MYKFDSTPGERERGDANQEVGSGKRFEELSKKGFRVTPHGSVKDWPSTVTMRLL